MTACSRRVDVEAAHDRRLGADELAAVADHARGCEPCGAHAAALAALGPALAALPLDAGDAFAPQRTRHRLLASVAAARGPRSRTPVLARLATTSAARTRVLAGAAVVAIAAVALAVVAWPRADETLLAAVAATGDAVTIAPTSARWSRHDAPGSTLVRLDDGALDLHVAHPVAAAAHRLVVSLPDGELDDLGTTFRVVVASGRTRAVSVSEGAVVVRLVGRPPMFLVAGESWSQPPPPVAMQPPPPPPAVQPSAVRPPAPAVPRPPAPPPAPSAAREFRDAAQLFDRGELTAAIAALRAFVAHHPDDSRAEDASYLVILALQRDGDAAGAREVARSYLERYPQGFRRAEVGELAR